MTEFSELMGSVGYLLLRWGIVEGELRKAVGELGGDPGGVAPLAEWKVLHAAVSNGDEGHMARVAELAARIEPARRMRNDVSQRSARRVWTRSTVRPPGFVVAA